MAEPKIDDVVARYVELRDELDLKRKEYQEFEKDQKEKMERLSMWLRDKSDDLGVNSFNTPHGTAYRSTKTYARVSNWDKVLKFIQDTGNWQMLEKRIGKLPTIEIIDDLGIEPSDIGVEYGADIDMLVRKN